ncbi:MAG TPA: aminopeptidase P family protein [Patescibacteria group bacterium]
MSHIEKAQQILLENNVDGLFISSPLQIGYVTNFFGISPTERESFVFVTKKACYILTSPLYFEDIKKTSPDCIAIELSPELSWVDAIAQIVNKEHLQKIGFEEYNLTVYEFKYLTSKVANLIPVHIKNLREIKDLVEIEAIKKACQIGDEAFTKILDIIKPGISELDIAFELENIMRKHRAIPSFPTIVAFGAHAAVPHHKSSENILEKNNFVLMDFGVQISNYCSDMTRTIYVGNISQEEKKLYQTVKDAQKKAFEYIQINSSHALGKEADKIAREYIVSQGYPQFPHSLGHGIGLEVHETPSLSPYSQDVLKNGMVFSIEPGIYLPNKTGVRIEDLVAITSSAEELTLSSKDLIII